MQPEEREFWISNLQKVQSQGNIGELRSICFKERDRQNATELVKRIIDDYGNPKIKGIYCDLFQANFDSDSGEVEYWLIDQCHGGEENHYRFFLADVDSNSITALEDQDLHFWFVTFHTGNMDRSIRFGRGQVDTYINRIHFGKFLVRDMAVAKELAIHFKALVKSAPPRPLIPRRQ